MASNTMTDDEIAKIEQDCVDWARGKPVSAVEIVRRVPDLLAEVKRLRAELDRATTAKKVPSSLYPITNKGPFIDER